MSNHSHNFKDLSNQKFGRLTVLNISHKDKNGHYYWKCMCDCGKIKDVLGTHLLRGNIVSCGCYCSEASSKRAKQRQLIPNKRIRNIWQLMKERCYNKKSISYKNYGARGIGVCNEWLNKRNGLINFYNWAISNGYNDDLTIDRIDTNIGYKPSNCKWSTKEQQCNNKRNNIIIEYNGEKNTVAYFIKKYNLDKFAIYNRIKNGWTVKRAIETPVKKNRILKKQI